MCSASFSTVRSSKAFAIAAHARTPRQARVAFSAARSLSPILRFGALPSIRPALGRGAHAQSGCLSLSAASEPISSAKVPHAIALAGCLSFGSQRTHARHQSAIRHCQVIADHLITSTSQRRLANCSGKHKGALMQGSSTSNGSSSAVLFSTPSASATSLTGRSTGRLPASLAAAC